MADQATVKRFNGAAATRASSGPADSSDTGVVENVASFGENLLTLAELQARLTLLEVRQNLDAARHGGLLLVVGAVLTVASLPVVLVGMAELLVSEMGLKRGYALLSIAAAAIAIALSCLLVARDRLRRKPFGFPVANEEFARNLNWLRTVLRHSGRSRLSR